jgi:hypothetical protein
MNGFALIGTNGGGTATASQIGDNLEPFILNTAINSANGIDVLGSQRGAHIYNGYILGWGGDGIEGTSLDNAIFSNLVVAYNNGDGVEGDESCIYDKVTVAYNGMDGINSFNGSTIKDCTAIRNGADGIQVGNSTTVINSTAISNGNDGFNTGISATLFNCTARSNQRHGFDLGIGSIADNCLASDQVDSNTMDARFSDGFELSSGSILRNSTAYLNDGRGVRAFSNATILNSSFYRNELDGIRITSGDTRVEGNSANFNGGTGIISTSSGSLFIRNRAANNTVADYNIPATNTFGPIIPAAGAGDLGAIAGSNHPLANLSF